MAPITIAIIVNHERVARPAQCPDLAFCVFQSEARLAARRQARAEAREIRMRELERQQREAEQNGEKLDDFSGEHAAEDRIGEEVLVSRVGEKSTV